MANRYYVGSGSPDNWSDSVWSTSSGGASGASVPGTGDVAICDANGTGNLLLDGHITSGGIDAQAGFGGDIDLATYDVTFDDGADCIAANAGTFDVGSGTHTLTNGTLNIRDCTTFTKGTAPWVFNGTSNYTAKWSTHLAHSLTNNGTLTVTHTSGINGGTLTNNGTLILAGWFYTYNVTSIAWGDNSTISGNTFIIYNCSASITRGSSVVLSALTRVSRSSVTVPAGAYAGKVVCGTSTLTSTVALSSGSTEFDGGLTLSSSSSGSITLDLNTNDPNVTVAGDATIDIDSTGGVTIIPGSGDFILESDLIDEITGGGEFNCGGLNVTLSGTADQAVDPSVSSTAWGAWTVNKTAGDVTPDSALSCASFTGTDGTWAPNGQDITATNGIDLVAGFVLSDPVGVTITYDTFDADGQTIAASGTWYLNGTTRATCVGVGSVSYCDASGGVEVNASAGPWVDGGNNDNWDFGGVIVPIYHLLTGAV